MIHYPHFAFKNIYLLSGYTEEQTEHGAVYFYDDEDGLEHLIRTMLLRKAGVLTGWDLRFLRQGLGITQAQLGVFLDRDCQTVARWEKSSNRVPRFVDLTIRSYFAEKFEPSITASELIAHIDGNDTLSSGKIIISFEDNKWSIRPRLNINSRLYSHSSLLTIDLNVVPARHFYLRGLVDKTSRLASIEADSSLAEFQLSTHNMKAYQTVMSSLTNQRVINEQRTIQ